MSLTNSSRTRSADTISSDGAISVIAATTSGAAVNPSWDTKRAARIIRSGSSAKDTSGAPGVRRIRAARSASPPWGSTNSSEGRRIAMALTAKSRRARSSSRLSPKATTGFRLMRSYASARYVVTSTTWLPLRAPIVPKARPTSQWASAQPARIASVCSGLADVVRSRSGDTRPRKASRTGPPPGRSHDRRRQSGSPARSAAAAPEPTDARPHEGGHWSDRRQPREPSVGDGDAGSRRCRPSASPDRDRRSGWLQ